jgi:hypothetical protein
MSMSIHIVGFIPPDDEWRKMKAVWDACSKAKVEPPKKVLDYFNDEYPDPEGVEVDVPHEAYRIDGREGFTVHLDKVPKHVKVIRVFNSW